MRQEECLAPFLFSMFLNDLEEEFITHGVEGIYIGLIKLFIFTILNANDIVIFSSDAEGLQNGLNLLEQVNSVNLYPPPKWLWSV